MAAPRAPASQRVLTLLDPGSDSEFTELWPHDRARRLALAWELKDECLAAWTTEPRHTGRCARVLQQLNDASPDPEVAALAAWAGGIAALAEGSLATSLPLLEQAQDALAAKGRTRAAAETMLPRVIALGMLGRHDEALACGEQARELFVNLGDHRGAGRVELNLATLLFRRDQHSEAARLYRSAAVHLARARDDAYSILADIGLAHALTWSFEFEEAQRINRRALRRAAQRTLRVPQAQARLAIGRIELLRGRFHRALPELVKALSLMDEAGAAPQQRLEAAGALADAYRGVNLLPEAQTLYDQVIETARDLDAPTEEARARVERARTHAARGSRAAALADLEQALALFDRVGNRFAGADVMVAAGAMRLDDDDAAGAAACASAALGVLRGSGVISWQLAAENLAAAAAARQGDTRGAGVGFASALERARTLGLSAQCVAAHVGEGELALRAGKFEAAMSAFALALDLVDTERAEMADDEFRVAFASVGGRAHGLYVRAALGRHERGEIGPGAVFEAIERGRARALSLGLHRSSAADHEPPRAGAGAAGPVASPPRPGMIVEPPGEGRAALLRQRWRDALDAGAAGGDLAGHLRELQRLEEQWLEVSRRERLQRRARVGQVSRTSERGWTDARGVQRALERGEALVLFHLERGQLVACVLRRVSAQVLSWSAAGLDAELEALRLQIDTPRLAGEVLRVHAPALLARVQARARTLHTRVWAPLMRALNEVHRVVIVPHGLLHYVPWCALHDGESWLVQQMEIELAASATAWLAATASPWRAPTRLFALGSGEEGLPHIRHELEAVARIFGPLGDVRLGDAARADALRTGAAQADVLHLACHGQFRADNPAFSSLKLADGPLILHDLQAMRLQAALVVLSACETGLSRVAPGDELVGLVRGFVLAGAERVLATQWSVQDASTATLMIEFYRHLAAGRRPAAALAAAQRAAAGRGEHPFQWAGLALYGRR